MRNTCHNCYNRGSQPIYSTGTNEDQVTLVWRCRQPGREVRDGTTTQADSYETKIFHGPDYRTTERSPGISYVPKAEEVWHDQGPRMCRWMKAKKVRVSNRVPNTCNGRASSTKRTKHIDIRYFYVKEKVDSKDVIVEYCLTEHMRADFFTKRLHGNLFQRL